MTPPRGRGNPNAKIMFVGEAYDVNEQKQGRPFVGPAGNVLNELCLKSGIDPDECYYTNIINDRPPENDLGKWYSKGVPNERVVEGLLSLADEIDEVKPNVIVPLGNWSLYTFYDLKLGKQSKEPAGILDYRGYVLEATKLARSTKIVPTAHPSYIMRGSWHDAPLVKLDLQRARAESAYPEIRRRPRTCIVDPDWSEREAIRTRLLTEGTHIVVDIEYIGSKLLCIGFAVSADWAVTIRTDSSADLAWCKSIIESGRPLCAQNAMFDFGILEWHYGIHGFENLVYDTMVAAYVLNIEYPKDLGFLGSFYTDMWAWWDVIDWDLIKAGKQSIDRVWEYNCYDNMVTYEAMEQQIPELATDPRMQEAFAFDMRKLRPLWETAKRGILVDQSALQQLRDESTRDAALSDAIINALCEVFNIGLKGLDFNVKSPEQVVTLLKDRLGVPFSRRTPPSSRFKNGQWKTDNETLMEYMRTADNETQQEAIRAIIRRREVRDLESKFLEIEWDTDGRSRCIYDCTKTVTRRLSSKKFFPTGLGTNLQNIPAPGSSTYGARCRRIFIPDPGYEFGYADLKGAEFLIVAHLTQDPLMLKYAQMSIDGTGDVHCETAAFIFSRMTGEDIKPSDIIKGSPRRFLGKKTRHSGNYLVGWKELQGKINAEAMETGVFVDARTTKGLIAGYIELHPGLPTWWDDTALELRQHGMLRNLFGFPRRFNSPVSQCLPEAVAFVPQSTVGDALNYGLIACHYDEELADLGYVGLLNGHDALGFQYPVGNRDAVLPRVKKLMEIPITIPKTRESLIIPIEMEIGPSWGDLEAWHG